MRGPQSGTDQPHCSLAQLLTSSDPRPLVYLPTWVPPRPLSQPPLCKALSLQTSLVNPSTFSLAEPSAGFKTLLSRHDQLIVVDKGFQTQVLRPQFIARPAKASLSPPPAHFTLTCCLLCPRLSTRLHHFLTPCPHLRNQRQLRGTAHCPPDLILPVGPLCHPLYPLKGSSACRGLGWGTQAASCPTLPPLQAPVGTGSPKGAGAPLGWAPGR